jgi:hypothetical protein
MTYHKNPEINDAIFNLISALCSWERHTGRCSTLIFVPHNDDEEIFVAEDGKPIALYASTPEFWLNVALREREKIKNG